MWWKRKALGPVEWKCGHCGGSYSNLPTDFGWKLPDEIWELGEDVCQRYLEWSTDVCHHEGRWFLRGVLGLPFTFGEGRWGWGCWAEVDEEAIQKLWKLDSGSGEIFEPECGVLACEVPGYLGSKCLPLEVHFGRADLRPLLVLDSTSDHMLAVHQRHGIDEAQYHAILDLVSQK